ncbi:hypothetical protein RRG08_029862 [Elysia crispata]|uniref:Uncharacterized protein n=1 Tax=Elysia crispata TaxID=231223 RepID=A0AAE0YJB0_9GAST|nr:hypothetical protein RRG08_029862 [Elysia crispata]
MAQSRPPLIPTSGARDSEEKNGPPSGTQLHFPMLSKTAKKERGCRKDAQGNRYVIRAACYRAKLNYVGGARHTVTRPVKRVSHWEDALEFSSELSAGYRQNQTVTLAPQSRLKFLAMLRAKYSSGYKLWNAIQVLGPQFSIRSGYIMHSF